jgi:hypothetical protein
MLDIGAVRGPRGFGTFRELNFWPTTQTYPQLAGRRA